MTHSFDQDYWDHHWQDDRPDAPAAMTTNPPHPHLAQEIAGLTPGTALDAGCGAGAEAIWLAAHGWEVTGADIAEQALARAAERVAPSDTAHRVRWVRADLSTWEPGTTYDLVTTFYAHPAMPQLDFYDRIAGWVAPGGTLLVVGHSHAHGHGHGLGHGHGQGAVDGPPPEAVVTAAGVTARLDPAEWQVVTANESGQDVVVRATRRRP